MLLQCRQKKYAVIVVVAGPAVAVAVGVGLLMLMRRTRINPVPHSELYRPPFTIQDKQQQTRLPPWQVISLLVQVLISQLPEHRRQLVLRCPRPRNDPMPCRTV